MPKIPRKRSRKPLKKRRERQQKNNRGALAYHQNEERQNAKGWRAGKSSKKKEGDSYAIHWRRIGKECDAGRRLLIMAELSENRPRANHDGGTSKGKKQGTKVGTHPGRDGFA